MRKDKRNLKINLDDLEDAFDNGAYEMRYYLDLETGDIILVTDDTRQQLGAFLETDAAETIEAVYEAIQKADVPDWQQSELRNAALVEFGDHTRFIEIPKVDSRQGYEVMQAFIETVPNRHLRELLQVATHGSGAFGRFKGVLASYAEERERWFEFRDDRLYQRVLDWLEQEGVNPIP